MVKYYRLASTEDVNVIDELERGMADGTADPNKAKRALARNIVAAYHGEEAAVAAEDHFVRTVVKKEVDESDVVEFAADLTPNDEGKVYLARIIADAKMAGSVGEARRLIDGGGVKIDGEPVPAKAYNVDPAILEGAILKVGKRKFARIVRA